MKKRNTYYLSYRVFFYVLLLLIFNVFLFLFWMITSILEKKYFITLSIFFAFLIFIIFTGYKYIYIPYKETKKVLTLFSMGYTLQGIYELKYPLSPEFEGTINKFKSFVNVSEMINASKRQAQYLALQNQINPHFLYNSLEGIRGEAISAGLNNLAEMTEALATFFRYIISNMEHLVTLEDELESIENYFIIQRYRFGERLNLNIEYDYEEKEEILKYRLPKLTLEPIVENSIFHGIERKMGDGNISIRIETTPKRLIITVSDDGMGINESRLMELNEKLKIQSFEYIKPDDDEKKIGIALINVNNRIKLLFGEEYGINIYSKENVGTDVEITLPRIMKQGDE
ncbi:two-component system, sensor histidine kinase YesM [Caloramator quimbayensis]|uniref:Two-component system, sensor histidine kinase YesM n=2 Tax=Caloramator quimbayensis TaxID=1147123 RepID=A0A1T4Y9X0_9CLOT|nr:two-component system, sensor histidine kinase YesM [Caloramator quimbayensis]